MLQTCVQKGLLKLNKGLLYIYIGPCVQICKHINMYIFTQVIKCCNSFDLFIMHVGLRFVSSVSNLLNELC